MNNTQPLNRLLTSRELGWLLIAIASLIQIARICGVTAVHGELPSLSANDRSRWSAIAALLEDGKWEIDRVNDLLDSKGRSKIWASIDIVRHKGKDGAEHFYSSKPPLLTLIYAAITKPITMITGKKVTEEPFLIMRIVLILVNVVPMIAFWLWWMYWLDKNVLDEWSRVILLNAGLWGTFLTTFTVTMNNHIHGAFFFWISLMLLSRIVQTARQGGTRSWLTWFLCGVSAGLTVACELPALSWAAAAGAILIFVDWKKLIAGYGLGCGLIGGAILATNIWAHGDWRPPYSHRGVGELIAQLPREADSKEPDIATVIEQVNSKGYVLKKDQAKFVPARLTDVLQLIDESAGQRVAIKSTADGKWSIYHWDDWYDYPKSYWMPGNKKGVDLGEPDRLKYTLHFLIGHHGIFSLTPFWFLIFGGAALWLRKSSSNPGQFSGLRELATSERGLAIAFFAISIACLVFYALREVEDRNYGGVSSGFRWLFWVIPAWLWLCVPAVESASKSKAAKSFVTILLLASVFSATIPWPNPWTHPWPFRVVTWLYPEKVEVKP